MFTVPHTFWTVTGNTLSKIARTPDDSVHLMASAWDTETRTALPETGLPLDLVDERHGVFRVLGRFKQPRSHGWTL